MRRILSGFIDKDNMENTLRLVVAKINEMEMSLGSESDAKIREKIEEIESEMSAMANKEAFLANEGAAGAKGDTGAQGPAGKDGQERQKGYTRHRKPD